jgi:hypothetical protein
MMSLPANKKIIGRAEQVDFLSIAAAQVHARIDSGARTSAIWASHAGEQNGKLEVVFFGPGDASYTGKTYYFTDYAQDIITSSTGHRQQRYKIKLSIVLKKRKIRATFTLADRSTQVYPVLIGRNVLRGKFVVDVTLGKTLREKERDLRHKNRLELNQEKEQQ